MRSCKHWPISLHYSHSPQLEVSPSSFSLNYFLLHLPPSTSTHHNRLFEPSQSSIPTCPRTSDKLKGPSYIIMSGQRVLQKWSAETHEAILIEVIDHLEVSTSDWKAIVQKLQAKGHTFTASALMYVSTDARLLRSDSRTSQCCFSGPALPSFPPPPKHSLALGSL